MKKLLSVLGLTAIMAVGGNVVQAQNFNLEKGMSANTVEVNKLEYDRLKRIEETYQEYGNENDELKFEILNLKQELKNKENLLQHVLNVTMHTMQITNNLMKYNDTQFESVLKTAEKSESNRAILEESMMTLIINIKTLSELQDDVVSALFGE